MWVVFCSQIPFAPPLLTSKCHMGRMVWTFLVALGGEIALWFGFSCSPLYPWQSRPEQAVVGVKQSKRVFYVFFARIEPNPKTLTSHHYHRFTFTLSPSYLSRRDAGWMG